MKNNTRGLWAVLVSCLAVAGAACSTQSQDQNGAGGGAGTSGQGVGGAGGSIPCPTEQPALGSHCEGSWTYCRYGQATCCGHVYPAAVLQCTSDHMVASSYHEAEDCNIAVNACADAGGYDAAAADPQTPACAASNPLFTPCDSPGQACRLDALALCICQAATSSDGSAAPFWYCR